MQVSEAGHQPVDDEGDEEAAKTDGSSHGVENWVRLTPIPIVPKIKIGNGQILRFSILVHFTSQNR